MSHFKELCSSCGTIIEQCRCPSTEKVITYDICSSCYQEQINTYSYYRRKAILVNAILFNGKNEQKVKVWSNGKIIYSPVLEVTKENPSGVYLQIPCVGGSYTTAIPGQYIYCECGTNKEDNSIFTICNAEVFHKKFENEPIR